MTVMFVIVTKPSGTLLLLIGSHGADTHAAILLKRNT